MAKQAAQPVAKKDSKHSTNHNLIDSIRARRSQELVIGLCGAIGSGINELDKELKTSLEGNGYKVERIKISDIIFKLRNDPSLSSLSGFEKYNRYQDAGNDIRAKCGPGKLAEAAIVDIVDKRQKYSSQEKSGKKDPDDHKNKQKVAYIINQLKNDAEVSLLQTVYRQNFYLVGLNSTEKERKHYLEQQAIGPAHIDELVHRDRKENSKHGQQVEKTFFLSDYFIRNKHNNAAHLNKAIERFIKLIHGYNGITPTNDEKGMYEAFSASLQSACLSRQVGAALMNPSGDVLSTGCNDVPVSGGGLYNAEHGNNDHRCIFKGKMCYNDHHKNILKGQFKDILDKHGLETESEKIANDLLNETKAKALIEYSRAIHAEMAALLQLARTEGQSTVGTTLYCTTYPCHSCARHLVAAGVSQVIYIEPYEKSLALQLHDDSITDGEESNKVKFQPFEGVSPRRYSKFFQSSGRKDNKGSAIIVRPADSHHVDPQYLDSYFDYEDKVVEETLKNPFQ